MDHKRKSYRCETCLQYFDRPNKLKNHQKRGKVKCDNHCNKTFCNYEHLEKHKRSIINPVQEISDINQKIQGKTDYNSDYGLQAVFLGKLHEIYDWTKEGLNYEMINTAIDHTFIYQQLSGWL